LVLLGKKTNHFFFIYSFLSLVVTYVTDYLSTSLKKSELFCKGGMKGEGMERMVNFVEIFIALKVDKEKFAGEVKDIKKLSVSFIIY
jgi:hypothetical protein